MLVRHMKIQMKAGVEGLSAEVAHPQVGAELQLVELLRSVEISGEVERTGERHLCLVSAEDWLPQLKKCPCNTLQPLLKCELSSFLTLWTNWRTMDDSGREHCSISFAIWSPEFWNGTQSIR